MGNARPTNFPMRQLGRTLRRLRVRAGLTQEDAGKRLRFSSKKMSRLELGQLPTYHELLAMLDLYGVIVSDWEPIVELFDRAQERGWWHQYGLDDRGFIGIEAESCAMQTFQLGYVPGLLQSAAYIRAVHGGTREPLEGDELEIGIEIRLKRQERLTDDPSFRLHAIMDETILTRPVCERAEQREQLEYIIERAALPNVTVQVVPQEVGAYSGQCGNLTLLQFPDPDEPDMAHLEHVFASHYIEKPGEVHAARLTLEYIADLALDEEDSIALIERTIAKL